MTESMKSFYLRKFAETGDLNYMTLAMRHEEERPAKDVSSLLKPS